jgi:hypothetical protein
LNASESRAKSLVDDLPERGMEPSRKGSRMVQDIIVNSQRRPHNDIIASEKMMSRHRTTSRWLRLVEKPLALPLRFVFFVPSCGVLRAV